MEEKDVNREITPELAEELKNAQEFEPKEAAWERQGTTITVSGGKWYWKDQCTENWWTYPNQIDFRAIGKCPSGQQLYRIFPR